MITYILELVDKDMFIEHLCRRESEREFNPTTYTMNAFKAETFVEEELEYLGYAASDVYKDHQTLLKIVTILKEI